MAKGAPRRRSAGARGAPGRRWEGDIMRMGGGSPGKHQEPPLVLYNRSRQRHVLGRDAMQVKALRALRGGPSNRHARHAQKRL